MSTFFVTGTNTGVGKTTIACGLLCKAKQQGLTTLAIKPVASGCELVVHSQLVNADALAMQSNMSSQIAYCDINPFRFEAAIAPHIAAKQSNVYLSSSKIAEHCKTVIADNNADFILIEGAGGWRVPLNDDNDFFSDIVKALNIPVLLVIGMTLGCLNYAALTAEAIAQDGLTLAGWIANTVDTSMLAYEENLSMLQKIIPAPCLGHLPFLEIDNNDFDYSELAPFINLPIFK